MEMDIDELMQWCASELDKWSKCESVYVNVLGALVYMCILLMGTECVESASTEGGEPIDF